MSKTIALLSGKGGSGKTTLSLCMSNLLSSVNKKVLLVDCDMSTSGATYFYESKLGLYGSKTIITFSDIIVGKTWIYDEELRPLSINENFSFIPSIVSVDQYDYSIEMNGKVNEQSIREFCEWAKIQYDIVFFDCQAGYSYFLPQLLLNMDTYLVVAETDAISSSALRVFHVKIAKYINQLKIYQVFNKASKEEYDIYSKISGGTMFTIIDTIEYNWKIRKDFALAQVPDFRSGNARFWQQVCNLCEVLFKEDVYSACDDFKKTILLPSIDKELKMANVEKVFGNRSHKSKMRILLISMVSIYSAVLTVMIFFLYYTKNGPMSDSRPMSLLLLFVGVISFTSAFLTVRQVLNLLKDFRFDDSNYKERKEELLRLKEELSFLKNN